MVDKEKLLEMADDIKSTIHEKQEQTVIDYKVYSICCQVQALLKEQEAKPVIVTTNAYGTRFHHCPKCNRDLDLYVCPRQHYCSNCGQAISWKEV